MSNTILKILAEVKISIMTFFLTPRPTPPYLKNAYLGPKEAENQKTKVTFAIWTHQNEEIG